MTSVNLLRLTCLYGLREIVLPSLSLLLCSRRRRRCCRVRGRHWRPVDEVPDLWPVLLQCGLLPLEVLQQAKDVRVGHVEASLAHVVPERDDDRVKIDELTGIFECLLPYLHVCVFVAQRLARLSLSPVCGGVEGGPTVVVLGVHLGAGLEEKTGRERNH